MTSFEIKKKSNNEHAAEHGDGCQQGHPDGPVCWKLVFITGASKPEHKRRRIFACRHGRLRLLAVAKAECLRCHEQVPAYVGPDGQVLPDAFQRRLDARCHELVLVLGQPELESQLGAVEVTRDADDDARRVLCSSLEGHAVAPFWRFCNKNEKDLR